MCFFFFTENLLIRKGEIENAPQETPPVCRVECSLSSRQTKKQKNIKLSEFHPVAQQGGIFHAAAAEWYSIGVIHLSFNW